MREPGSSTPYSALPYIDKECSVHETETQDQIFQLGQAAAHIAFTFLQCHPHITYLVSPLINICLPSRLLNYNSLSDSFSNLLSPLTPSWGQQQLIQNPWQSVCLDKSEENKWLKYRNPGETEWMTAWKVRKVHTTLQDHMEPDGHSKLHTGTTICDLTSCKRRNFIQSMNVNVLAIREQMIICASDLWNLPAGFLHNAFVYI